MHSGSSQHAAQFRAATDAYAILTDLVQRRRFDDTGSVDQVHVSVSRAEIFAAVEYVRSVAASARRTAQWAAFKGVLWLTGGALVTAVGYAAASSSPEGGTYFVMWGAILFGALQAVRGLSAYVSIGSRARKIECDIWSTITEHEFGSGELS